MRAIGGVLDGIRAQRPTLKYVVILGGDDIVPQARLSDFTTLANEYEFADTFDASTALGGALRNSTFLSDDPYGDVDPVPYLNRQLHVPDLALGRLVEDPVDIVGAITRFAVADGRLDPTTSFDTGYDFLTDGANRVNAAFAAEVGQANAAALINNSWTRAQFLAGFLSPVGGGPGLNALNGHADPSALQPAARAAADRDHRPGAGRGQPEQPDSVQHGLPRGPLAARRLHRGRQRGLGADVRAARRRRCGLANTGYGYGDTLVNAYGELLNGLFAENLLAGTMTAGEALSFAKQAYLAESGVFGVFDEKSMGELTFYGLPMYGVGGDHAAARGRRGRREGERRSGRGRRFVDPVDGPRGRLRSRSRRRSPRSRSRRSRRSAATCAATTASRSATCGRCSRRRSCRSPARTRTAR